MDHPIAPPLPDRIARQLPAGITRERVELTDVGVHVMSQGSGRTVLCVHGNPTWSFLYRRVFAALTDAPLRLVAPDLPGLGLSDRVPFAHHTLDRHAAWMTELVERLDLRDVILVVQDWGGPIGLLGVPSDRIAGLVVLNTVIGPPKPGFKGTLFHRAARWPVVSDVAFRVVGFPQGWLGGVQGDPATIGPEVTYAYTWPLRGLSRNAAPLALARMVPDSMRHPSIPALQRLADKVHAWSGPTAIVWGDKDPVLGRVRTHVERTLPHARVWRTDAGHFLQEEVPDVVAEAILHVRDQLDG